MRIFNQTISSFINGFVQFSFVQNTMITTFISKFHIFDRHHIFEVFLGIFATIFYFVEIASTTFASLLILTSYIDSKSSNSFSKLLTRSAISTNDVLCLKLLLNSSKLENNFFFFENEVHCKSVFLINLQIHDFCTRYVNFPPKHIFLLK